MYAVGKKIFGKKKGTTKFFLFFSAKIEIQKQSILFSFSPKKFWELNFFLVLSNKQIHKCFFIKITNENLLSFFFFFRIEYSKFVFHWNGFQMEKCEPPFFSFSCSVSCDHFHPVRPFFWNAAFLLSLWKCSYSLQAMLCWRLKWRFPEIWRKLNKQFFKCSEFPKYKVIIS